MWKFFQGWFEPRYRLLQRLERSEYRARYWRNKYRNAKKWIEEINDGVYSYEDGEN